MKYKHCTKAFPFGEGGTAIAVTDEGVIYLFSYHLAEVILFAKLYVCSKKCIIPRQKAGDWFVMLFTGNITIPSGFGQ